MAIRVGAFQAKALLSKLLEFVRGGERVIITKHGVPVAELIPARPQRHGDAVELFEELRSIRRRTKPASESIQSLRDEGRRF